MDRQFVRVFSRCVAGVWLACVMAMGAQPAVAQRAPAPQLFPSNTVVFLSLTSAADFKERFSATALGRMGRDPQLQPLLEQVYGTLAQAFQTVQDRVGASLDDLLAVPQGELAIGVVAREMQPPGVIALVEARDNIVTLNKLLQRAEVQLEERGAQRTSQVVGDVELVLYTLPAGPNGVQRRVAWCEKAGHLLLSNDQGLLQGMLEAWESGRADSLAQNPSYAAILSRCRSSADDAPQFIWYVDPIELVRTAGANNAQARVALAILPALGLDGLKALGGTVALSTEQYDYLTHVHVLLESPRAGVVELIALSNGDNTPPAWVPADAASYFSLNWDFARTYDKLERLIDSFQGQGAFARAVADRGRDRLGVDVRAELVSALEGRVVLATWIEKPVTLTSQATIIGLRLKDATAFQPVLDKITSRFAAQLSRQNYGGVPYYELNTALPNPNNQGEPRRPCIGIVGTDLVIADRTSAFHRAVAAASDPANSLAEALDYKLVASKISRHPGGTAAAMISFNRPEEGMRMIYDLLTAEQTREGLRRGAQQSELLRGLNQALEQNPLPPFAVLQQYLAPGGGVLSDDETGIHYTSFALRRKE